MAALGPGKGNFGANCGKPGATRLIGFRARRRTVVPDGRESQGMEWESIKGTKWTGSCATFKCSTRAPRMRTVSRWRTRIGDTRLVNRRRDRDAYKTNPPPR